MRPAVILLTVVMTVSAVSCAQNSTTSPPATNITSMPSLNKTTNQTEVYSPATSAIYMIVSPPGSGSVSPSTGNYTWGTNVTFIAIPNDPYVFQYWSYDFTVYNGGGGGYLGDNHILNFAVERSENVTAHFVAPPSIWNNALFYWQAHQKVAPGEYFIIDQDYIGGPFGIESLNATYDGSLVALIDRKNAGGKGPITPGLGINTAWLLFKALKPGAGVISVAQVRGSYVEPPKTYSVTIGN